MRTMTHPTWSPRFKKMFSCEWPRRLAVLGFMLLASTKLHAQATVTTIGGGSVSAPYYGYVDGLTISVAKFDMPSGMALDPSGTFLFVADYNNNAIRLVSNAGNTTTSYTSEFANATSNKGADGINHPLAVLVDAATNVYVLNHGDGANGALLHMNGIYMNTGQVIDDPPLAINLQNATAMCMDGLGNFYVTVSGNTVIRVTPAGVVSTIGIVSQAGTSLQGIAFMDNGQLALSDSGNDGIWLMNPLNGVSTKFTGFHGAGDLLGAASAAAFQTPETISKAGGGVLVVADRGNNKVKIVDQYGTVSLLYGVSSNLWVTVPGSYPGWWDGPGLPAQGSAESRQPYGVVVAQDGSVYASEVYYHVLRHITGTGFSAPQPGYPQFFNAPAGIAFDPAGTTLYIADYTNNAVQELNLALATNQTSTFLSSGNGVSHPASVLVDTNDNVYVLNQNSGTNGSILKFDNYGNFYGTIVTGLNQPTALTMDGNGNIFITELSGSIRVLFPNGATNTIATINTNFVNLKTNVQLEGIAIFDDGNLAVSDAGNHVIWTVNPLTKLISKLTGQLGTNGIAVGASNFARLYQPHQLARAGGDQIVAADYGNNRLVLIQRNGTITTNTLNSALSEVWLGKPTDPVAGSTVPMHLPAGVAVNSSGFVFDSEATNQVIRGLTTPISAPPPPPIVTLPFFNDPKGIAYDGIASDLYIADYGNNAVQMLDLNSSDPDFNLTSTFLTTTDGVSNPVSVLVDTNENIYVLNQGTPGNGSILEFDNYGNAYGPIVTGLNQPTAFTMDGYGNIFVTEQSGKIRAFGASISNTIVTITNVNVSLQGIAIFDDGSLAVSDAGNQVIWSINTLTKLVTRLTGQLGVSGVAVGASNFAKLYQPHQLARVGGNQIVAADYGNNRLVLVQRNGTVITNNLTYHLNSSVASIWFGQDGDPVTSGSPKFVPMALPSGIAYGVGGEIFASETYYEDIRGLTGTGLAAPTFNPGVPLPFYSDPAGIVLNNENTLLFIADPVKNSVSILNLVNNQTTGYLGSNNGLNQPVDVAVDGGDNLYVLNRGTGGNGSIMEFDQYGNLLATNAAGLSLPSAMTLDSSGDIYLAEQTGMVQQFSSGVSNTVAIVTNTGVMLQGIALLDSGTIVLSDASNHVIWQVNPVTKAVSLFTGQIGSPGTNFGSPAFARLNQPYRLAHAAGDLLLAADSGNNRVVVINNSGSITNSLISTNATIWFGLPDDPVTSSSPEFVPMVLPIGLAINGSGGVFASENFYKDIREMLATGISQSGSGGGGGGGGGTNVVVQPPVITPNSGYYPMGQTILVTSPNPGVYYTIDGSDPTTNSTPVVISGNVGTIHWFSTMTDLTSLRVTAFIGTNASVTVSGQPVTAADIGTPPDFNPSIQAGIGASIVIPVVCNLPAGATVKSFQYRYEIAPVNNVNTPVISPLSISTNDFVPLVTTAPNNVVGLYSVTPYSLGTTNGLEVSTAITNGNNGNVDFQHFAALASIEVQIPYTANVGDTYAVNVLFPSATSDGFNTPVPLTPMATTIIEVTNIPYTVGDSASAAGSWYNAGTFGDGNLDNSDVNQAFYAASGLRVPYTFSDVFNAMDAYPPDANGFVGGDGQIRFLDWQTILARSLRLDPADWARVWSAGGDLVDYSTNLVVPHALAGPSAKINTLSAPWYRQVLLGAASVGYAVPGTTVDVPVYTKLADGSTLSGLQFRAVVTPQGDAPALTVSPQLTLAAGVTGPLLTKSFKAGETAFGWQLDSFDYLSRSSNFLGWVSFTIPPTATTGQSYIVSLANADGSPDADTQYDFETRSATVTVNAAAPPATICSDEWKIYFFGSTTNPAAADDADPDHDGMPNWMEFLAGTDPTSALSKLEVGGVLTTNKGQNQMNLNWLTAPGRAYALQWSSGLANGGAWNTLTTVSGTGATTNCPDANPAGAARFYRLYVLP
jgi:sugar lactone lactonase YvrE